MMADYFQHGTNGTDALDVALVGRGWDGQTLAPSGTGAQPWATEL